MQELYLAGDKVGAINAVPDALADAVSLCGSPARIKDRLALWRACPITTLSLITFDLNALRLMAELVL